MWYDTVGYAFLDLFLCEGAFRFIYEHIHVLRWISNWLQSIRNRHTTLNQSVSKWYTCSLKNQLNFHGVNFTHILSLEKVLKFVHFLSLNSEKQPLHKMFFFFLYSNLIIRWSLFVHTQHTNTQNTTFSLNYKIYIFHYYYIWFNIILFCFRRMLFSYLLLWCPNW